MKLARLLIAVIVPLVACLTLPTETARAQDGWRQMPIRSQEEYNLGLVGGEATQHLHGIARSPSNPDVIYMSHDVGQVWKSVDAGATWQKCLGNGMHVIAGQSIEVDPADPDTVLVIMDSSYNYLVDDQEGLYKSTDGGRTWQLVLQTTSTIHRMYRHNIAYDPTSVSGGRALRWYAAFPNNALFRSEDGGQTWTQTADLSGHSTVYAVYAHPGDSQTVYLASEDGLFRSTSRGTNLQPLGDLPTGNVSSMATNAQDASTIYATVLGQGLYRSTNGGANFSLVRSFDAARVFLNPGYPDKIYLIGQNTNSMVSSDAGGTWTTMVVTPAPGLGREWKNEIQGQLSGVVPNPTNVNEAVAYSLAQCWKTTDGGLHFTDSSTRFTGFAWGWWQGGMAFDRFDPDRLAMFCADVSMVITENSSDWWTRRRIPWEWYQQGLVSWIGTYAGDFQPIEGSQVVVASAGMYWDTKLVRSANGGADWTIVDNSSENNLFIAFHPGEANLVFAGNKKSTDAGLTWQPIAQLDAYSASIFGMSESNPDTLYAISRDPSRDKILRSDDRGQNWRVYADVSWTFTGMDSKPTFAVHPTDPNKVYTLDSQRDLAVFDGTTWRSLGVMALAGGQQYGNFVRAVALDPRHPEIIYAETHTAGLPYIFRSTDSGATWANISENLSQCGGGTIAVNPHTGDLLHGSAFGTWVYPPPYDSPQALYWKLGPEFSVSRWQVVADHGPAGTLVTTVGDNFTEPRLAGLRKLAVQFTRPVDPATLLPGAVTITGQAGGDVSSLVESLTLDGARRTLTIALSAALPDADLYTVAITSGLKDFLGASAGGDSDLTLRVLAGDVDGSGSVTQADMLVVRAAGLVVDAERAPTDIDQSGTISAGDMSAVRCRLGNQLP